MGGIIRGREMWNFNILEYTKDKTMMVVLINPLT